MVTAISINNRRLIAITRTAISATFSVCQNDFLICLWLFFRSPFFIDVRLVIRFFNGLGILVWGARTLDGNSQDWRYVPVRRTVTYIEQSVKQALQAFVFAPNDANTWGTVQSMINSFLTGLWSQGGLQGMSLLWRVAYERRAFFQ